MVVTSTSYCLPIGSSGSVLWPLSAEWTMSHSVNAAFPFDWPAAPFTTLPEGIVEDSLQSNLPSASEAQKKRHAPVAQQSR
jgi:hypothetical protein